MMDNNTTAVLCRVYIQWRNYPTVDILAKRHYGSLTLWNQSVHHIGQPAPNCFNFHKHRSCLFLNFHLCISYRMSIRQIPNRYSLWKYYATFISKINNIIGSIYWRVEGTKIAILDKVDRYERMIFLIILT